MGRLRRGQAGSWLVRVWLGCFLSYTVSFGALAWGAGGEGHVADAATLSKVKESIQGLPTLVGSQEDLEIGSKSYYLEDAEGRFTIQDILHRLGEFKKPPEKGPNFGLTQSAYWFATLIERGQSDASMVLEIKYPLLDYVDVYYLGVSPDDFLSETGLIIHQGLGDRLSFDARYRTHRTLNAQLKPTSSITLLLIRVQTEGSVQFPAFIKSERSFGDHAAAENAGLFLYYGVILVMAFFNIFLWAQTRDFVYLPYVGYLLAFLTFAMTMNGTVFQWILPDSPVLVNGTLLASACATGALGVEFTRQFMAPVIAGQGISRFLMWFAAFFGGLFVACWFLPYGALVKVVTLGGAVTPFVLVTAGVKAYRAGYAPARYFLLAWISFLVGMAIFALKTFGLLPASFFTEFAVQVGSALEVTLLSLALGDKMNQVAVDRERLASENLQKTEDLVKAESAARREAEEKVQAYSRLDEELTRGHELQNRNAKLQREMEDAGQQLIQADKLATLGTLVAGVAHDIANPTGLVKLSREEVLKGYEQSRSLIYELLGEPEDDETRAIVEQFDSFFLQQKSGLADIELGVTRIAAINGAIRNQSRSDTSVSQVSVRELIDECLTIVGSRLKEVEVTIRCDDALQVEVIRSQFGQVLMNLLANAADAVSEGSESKGRIRVSASRNDDATVKILIEDSGPGIPIELREKILQPFFTTKAVGKGTGLGMPIVVRILQEHGFELRIENSDELGGAALMITSGPAQIGEV